MKPIASMLLLCALAGGGSHSGSPSLIPIHHRTLDHVHSSGRDTRPRRTGLW